MKGLTFAEKLGKVRREEACVRANERRFSYGTSIIGRMLKSWCKTSSASYRVEYKTCGTIEVSVKSPYIKVNGKVRMPSFDSSDRAYHSIDNITCLLYHLKFFFEDPTRFTEYMCDDRMQLNHMVETTNVNECYRSHNYAPLFEAEVCPNIEMVSRRENNLHGRFLKALNLYGMRVPVDYIPLIEKLALQKVGYLDTNLYSFELDSAYAEFRSISTKDRLAVVQEAHNLMGDKNRVDYTEFL